ncbi:MAG: DUF1822 family protein, partial [Cyanobacteria bacterium P01_D01_bin.44]
MDFNEAFELINGLAIANMGRSLKKPEVAILEGTWHGFTYAQIANLSEYSANYLMRDVAPKLWTFLSNALGISIGKTNFRLVLDKAACKAGSQAVFNVPDAVKRLSVKPLGNMSVVSEIEGYPEELAALERWVLQDQCRLLSIYGLSGTGKTVLARRLVENVGTQFEQVIWQSSIPHIQQLIENLLGRKSHGLTVNYPDPVSTFLDILNRHSYLIVFDAVESILQPGELAGRYRSGYEDYGQLLQQVGELPHRSCLVMTGLENSPETARFSDQNSPIRTLHLKGFSEAAAAAILETEHLAYQDRWHDLICGYQGNPAALRIAAQTIRELFDGNIDAFLAQQSFVFGSINLQLKQSFDRVSRLEKDILFWLAGEDQPVSLATLQNEIPLVISPTEILEALESLLQRSLLETTQAIDGFLFLLQPLVKEYVVYQFIAQVCRGKPKEQQLSSQELGPVIELGLSTPKTARLSQWSQHQLEPGWQPMEFLFEESAKPARRLRSTYHLRDETIVKRFKSINLMGAKPGSAENIAENHTVALLVAVSQIANQTYQICVQVQPVGQTVTLPAGLRLRLLDEQSTV